MTAPSQAEVNSVTFFVETATAAAQEPFFSRDVIPSFRGTWETERAICAMGDRFHFRSAAIHFQRLWNATDEAHWGKTVEILSRIALPSTLKDAVKWRAELMARNLARESHPEGIGLTVQRSLELGLNAFVVPAGHDQLKLRQEFEAKAHELTPTVFECAFRHNLYVIGFGLIEYSQKAAQPALEWFRTKWGLGPTFEPGLPQRLRRREKTADGRMIVREGFSERPHEEMFAERFTRLLRRDENRQIEQILKHLEASPGELQRSILRGEGFRSLIKVIEGKIQTYQFPADRVGGLAREDFVAAGNMSHPARFCLYHGNFVLIQEGGVEVLDGLLARFRQQLISD